MRIDLPYGRSSVPVNIPDNAKTADLQLAPRAWIPEKEAREIFFTPALSPQAAVDLAVERAGFDPRLREHSPYIGCHVRVVRRN